MDTSDEIFDMINQEYKRLVQKNKVNKKKVAFKFIIGALLMMIPAITLLVNGLKPIPFFPLISVVSVFAGMAMLLWSVHCYKTTVDF